MTQEIFPPDVREHLSRKMDARRDELTRHETMEAIRGLNIGVKVYCMETEAGPGGKESRSRTPFTCSLW